MTCTWVDCNAEATVPQLDNNRKPWAHLCAEHDAQINRAIENADVKGILSGWVKAQGGAKAAAARMTGKAS